MRSELSPPEAALIVRHLMSGCTECLKVTRPFWDLMELKRLGGRR